MPDTKKLLENEKMFMAMNRELEDKTQDILKQANNVLMKNLESVADITKESTPPIKPICKRNTLQNVIKDNDIKDLKTCKPKNNNKGTLEDYIDDYISDSDNKMSSGVTRKTKVSTNGLLKYLKAKTQMLQNELNIINTEHKKQCETNLKLMETKNHLEETNIKINHQNTVLKSQLARQDANFQELNTKSILTEKKNFALEKDLEKLKNESKSYKISSNTSTAKLHKVNEQCEHLKQEVKSLNQQLKEQQEQHKKNFGQIEKQLKSTEKFKDELLTAIGHQMGLVDNLKRQNDLLLCSKLGEFTEKEYRELLDSFNRDH